MDAIFGNFVDSVDFYSTCLLSNYYYYQSYFVLSPIINVSLIRTLVVRFYFE